GTPSVHRAGMDRRAIAFDWHGTNELLRAGEAALVGSDASASRKQLQSRGTWTKRHWEEPHLQKDQPEQHPRAGWADDWCESFLQDGPTPSGPRGPMGRGGVR